VTGLIVALAGCSSSRRSSALAPGEAARLLVDRNWIDRLPERAGDKLHVYRFIPSMGSSGVYQDRTLYAGQFELFGFAATGDEIRFDLLHTGDRATTRYTVESVDEKPFDLRLVLERDPRGPATYFGWRDEKRAAFRLPDLR